jgi:peptidoglycan/LPS O-acetylase OafA/YrhL
MEKTVYHKDIDLLRAIAVIAVVIFHFQEAWLPSGYLGVDLFFVISGFVITLQIAKQHKEGSFNMIAFFQRRIKRILPLVTAVVLCTLLISPFIVMRAGLKTVALDANSALLCYSNIWHQLSLEGYWSEQAHNKLFLHFWSLAVEEQFYLCYPIIFVTALKLKKLNSLISLILIASLTYFLWAQLTTQQNLAFFSTPTRMWQLLTGALIATQHNKFGRLQEYYPLRISCLLLLGSSFLIPTTAYSGLYSIPFTLVAGLNIIIFSNIRKQFNNKTFTILQHLGVISFSIYLWHWLLIRCLFYGNNDLSDFAIFCPLLIALSAASYYIIEKRFRYNSTTPRNIITGACFPLIVSLAILATYTNFAKYNGTPTSHFNDLLYDISPENIFAVQEGNSSLSIGVVRPDKPLSNVGLHESSSGLSIHQGTGPNAILLFGDSHASMWGDCVKQICYDNNYSANAFCGNNLRPYFKIPINTKTIKTHSRFSDDQMITLNQNKMLAIESGKFDLLIIASRWSHFKPANETLTDFINYARKHLKVLIITEPPTLDIGNTNATQHAFFEGTKIGNSYYLNQKITTQETSTINWIKQFDGLPNVSVFTPDIPTLNGQVEVIKDGIPLYFDDDHLSSEGTLLLRPNLEKAIQQLLQTN